MLNHVIVVGCQRSGTTLAGQVLGAHPEAVLIDENDGLYKWVDALMEGRSQDAVDRLFESCCKAASRKYRSRHRQERFSDEGGLRPNIKHLVLKAPNLTYSAAGIKNSFGKASVISMTRDIRGVVASMKKLSHIPMVENQLRLMKTVPEVASHFSREIDILEDPRVARHLKMATVAKIKMSVAGLFQDRGLDVLQLRYEDLVDDLEGSLRGMAEHAGMDESELCLRHHTVFGGLGPGFTDRSRPVDGRSLERWMTRLSPQEERDIWESVGDFMTALDYERGVIRPPEKWKTIAPEKLFRPVVAVGRGGSGTRLLSALLLELGVFLGNRLNRSNDSLEWVSLIYEMVIKRLREQEPAEETNWRDLALEKAGEVLTAGQWDKRSRWGWKVPETTLVVPEIADIFARAQVVHLVRHPVDASLRRGHRTSRPANPVGASVLKAAYRRLDWDEESVEKHPIYLRNAASWLYQVESLMQFGRKALGHERYLEIRFEDLCASPRQTYESLNEFLGIGAPALQTDLGIDPARIRAWAPPDSRAEEVWRICGEVAEQLGYASSPTSAAASPTHTSPDRGRPGERGAQ